MARLTLRLLGAFQTLLDDQASAPFKSNKVRALLAYLAVEADRPHRRERLAGLLWPDIPERAALKNLRSTLSSLRVSIGDQQADPPYILIARDAIQFNRASNYWLDVAAFTRLAGANPEAPPSIEQLEQALAFYCGPFLEGFSLKDSVAFDEWSLIVRERLTLLLSSAQHNLAVAYEQQGDHERALTQVHRQLAINPLDENAHRHLMRLLVFSGQPAGAAAQYEMLRRTLQTELGVAPSPATVALLEDIRQGRMGGATAGAWAQDGRAPAALSELGRNGLPRTVFVAREKELAKLNRLLDMALAGRGQVAFVTGDRGSGKTALLREFGARAAARHAGLLPACGSCHAYTGAGDPYVPFREVAQALQEHAVMAAWKDSSPVNQADLHHRATKALQDLACQHPLILAVDDMQWADSGSISLLFHLGRHLAGYRIMLVGAYRPDDTSPGRDGKPHPLESIVREFKRQFGDITVDMDGADGRRFVETFLDSEPNRLGSEFRQTLFRHTSGHALFTIELLRGLQERGHLYRDISDRWVAGHDLDWEALPARVEAVINDRISRLPAPEQKTLTIASVQGDEFTAEVVAQAQNSPTAEIVERLSGLLSTQRLVQASGILPLGDKRLSRYRFRHHLFQAFLYNRLDAVERAYLHEAVARATERLFAAHLDEAAVQLAWHYEEAGLNEKAAAYALEAARRAVRLSANQEAIAHLQRGLELLATLPETPQRDQTELALRLSLYAPLNATAGYASPELGRSNDRAVALCQRMGETPQLIVASLFLAGFYSFRAESETALALDERALALAERLGEQAYIVWAQQAIGFILMNQGNFVAARQRLDTTQDCDAARAAALLWQRGTDTRVVYAVFASWVYWFLGYADRSQQLSQQALALAREIKHPPSLAMALNLAGAMLHLFCHEYAQVTPVVDDLAQITARHGLAHIQTTTSFHRGRVMVHQGDAAAGLDLMRQGLGDWQATGTKAWSSMYTAILADACREAGSLDQAQRALDEAFSAIRETGEGIFVAEVNRIQGDICLSAGNDGEAERCYRQAIAAAQRQQARTWELRATASLSRLLQRQGRRDEARQELSTIYDWFTEGFSSPDLMEARTLLEQL